MEDQRDLLRGNTPTLILAILQQGPRHGYSIAHEIGRLSQDALKLKQGTLYPVLQGLERDGLILGEWELQPGERPRRVYVLTEAGQKELERRARTWNQFATIMDTILGEKAREQSA